MKVKRPALVFVLAVCPALLVLSGCGSLADSLGNTVMEAKSFGRDLEYYEEIEGEYDKPIDSSMSMPGWVTRSGIPLDGLKKFKAKRLIGSKGNVGPAASGVAKLIDAGADLSPL
jgi:hypothetical protein